MSGLIVTPAVVEFKDVRAGAGFGQTILVTVKNAEARTKTLRLRPPKGNYFTINGFNQATKLAAGLTTTFEVVFQCDKLEDVKELVADRIVLQSESGDKEVQLRGLLSRPDVTVVGDLNFGILPSESKATKKITLTNIGHAVAPFKLDWDRGQAIIFEPATGELAPFGQSGSSMEVKAIAAVSDSGSASGEVTVIVNGIEGRRLTYSATVVKQAFELLEENGAKVTKMDFGVMYFGDTSQRTIHIFNNGPLPVKFVTSFGTVAEMRGRAAAAAAATAGEEEGGEGGHGMGGGGMLDDTEDPYAGIIMAARMKDKARASDEHAFELSTLMGSIAPYSRAAVNVSFRPKAAPMQKGFEAAQPDADAAAREFDYMVLVEFSGLPHKLRMPLRGRGIPGGLRLSPPILDFGAVATNQWADQLVDVSNFNSSLAARFEIIKIGTPYFECQPMVGTVLPGQTVQLLVRYLPKAMGRHTACMPVRVVTARGATVEEVPLRMSGSALVPGGKVPLVGGTDKLPANFTRPRQFIDSDHVVASTHGTGKKTMPMPTTQKLMEKPDVIEAFADIGQGNKLAMSKAEFLTMRAHRDQATSVMRAAGTQKKYAAANRRVTDDDVNMGMNTRSGLRAPEVTLPRTVDPLWTVASRAEAKPRAQKGPNDKELEAISMYKEHPEGEVERIATSRELSKEQINALVVGPKMLDFGNVSMGAATTQYVVATNTMDTAIHMVIDLRPHPDLRTSKHNSQVIPPGMRAKFPITCHGHEVHCLSGRLEYCVNGAHLLSIGVTANIVPVNVELSAEDLHFDLSLDTWEHYSDRLLVLDNPNKFPVEYDLEITSDEGNVFSVQQQMHGSVKAGSSGEIAVRWTPPADAPPSSTATAQLRITLVGGDGVRKVALRGETPEGNLRLRDKVLDAGFVACGIPQTRVVQIKNTGSRDSAFRVLPHAALRALPDRSRVGPDETVDVEVTFMAKEPGLMTSALEVEVRGGRKLKLPFKAEGMVPTVEVLQEEFAAGQVYIGSVSRLPVTLTNVSGVAAVVACDLRLLPEFELDISKDAWSVKQYETCPLQRVGPGGDVINDPRAARSGVTIMSRQSRRMSHIDSMMASAASGVNSNEGCVYHINLLPSASLQLQLVYKPTRVKTHAEELAFVVNTNGIGSPTPVRRVVTADGVQPQLVFSRTLVDFGSRVVIRSNQIKAPYSHDIYLTNTYGKPLTVVFGPATSTMPEEGGSGVFTIEPQRILVKGGDSVSVSCWFCPRDARTYEGAIPVYLADDEAATPTVPEGEEEGEDTPEAPVVVEKAKTPPLMTPKASSAAAAVAAAKLASAKLKPGMKPYLSLEVKGAGQYPRLAFDVRECVLPPVPLGVRSEATFLIQNNGYDNLELQYRLPADETHLPIKVEFPEGTLIGIAKQSLPVKVTFESSKPLSFTANIDFMDEDGKRYSMAVTGTADNCLLSHQAFMQVNQAKLAFQIEEGQPIQLAARAYLLPDAKIALGPLKSSNAIAVFLMATTSRGPFENMAKQMVGSRGKIMVEMVEQFCGKPIPHKLARLPANKKDAAEALIQQHDAMLVLLKSHGALLNHVKPEMLLEFDDFCRIMTARSLVASKPEEVEALDLWSDVEERFESVSIQAWNTVIQQVFKVFILARVTPKSFKQLPGAALLIGTTTPEATCVGSNVFSVAESILLAWMTALYAKEFPGKASRVTNFDRDLASGVVLFACLVGYWPALSRRRKDLKLDPVTQQHYQDNADLVVQALQEMGLPYTIRPEDLLIPDAREAMVFVLYLYQTLPQFMPRTTIEFASKLGEVLVKDLELTNPSKKAISYTARLEGHRDFAIDASVLRIDPKGTVKFPVRCTPSTSVSQEARLVLMSRKDGGAHAATLVFLLQSKVNTRAPLRRVRTEGPLYEMQAFEFTITNPFPADGDFTILLIHEPVVPLAKKEPSTQGKGNRGRASSGFGGRRKVEEAPPPEPPKTKIWPDAFGLERTRIRLKTQANDKLKGLFLPFTTGLHQCTVVFRDKDQGEFCYELIGEAGLPPPGLELKGGMALEKPTAYELVMPYQNPQLEQARRVFLDRHPLAKEKDQALLIRTDLFKGADIAYTVTQTNSLITCPSTFTLTAAGEMGGPAGLPGTDTAGRTKRISKIGERLSAAAGGAPAVPGDAPTINVMKLNLKPVGTGIYPTRLLFTSALDVRVVDLELSAQVMTQQFSLEFEGAARQAITQSVPLVNAGDATMTVKATIEGSAFTGAREINVLANASIDYQLTYKPTTVGEHRGTLELLMPATGEKNVYTLTGRAGEPVADGHIVLECQARKTVSRSIAVLNVFGAPVEYKVLCDLDFVSGAEVLRINVGSTGTYKVTTWPSRSGSYFGTLTFMAPDGQFVWYSVEVRASEPPEMGTIQVSSQVRKAVAMAIHLSNPLSTPITMRVQYGHPALVGPNTVTLPAGGSSNANVAAGEADTSSVFECFFAPLNSGDSTHSLAFVSEEVGEYVYSVQMHADPAPAMILEEMMVELGRSTQHMISIENPTDSPALLTAIVSGPAAFTVDPVQAVVQPYSKCEFAINYSPACLGEVEEATIALCSEQIGDYEYSCSGQGELPLQMEMTTVTARIGSVNQTTISWRNPFPEPVAVSIALQPSPSTPAGTFELLRHGTMITGAGKSTTVAVGGTLQLPVTFFARTLQLWAATLLVEMPASKFSRQPLEWRYPVTGIAEAADSSTVFRYHCKARGSTEEVMEIQLAGLASISPDDHFTHELVIPVDVRSMLDASALSVAAEDTQIATPDQALRYRLTFAPRCMLSASVEFIVYKSTGGRWRFEVQLQATEPDIEGIITIEASMGQTTAIPVYVFASGDEPEPFTASFTSDTPLSFNVLPAKGMLYPRMDGQQDSPPMRVTYTCRELGKVLQGRLHIHTASGNQYSYELHGTVPTYIPPSKDQMLGSVDHKLSPTLAARLGKPSDKRNYIANNIKTGKR